MINRRHPDINILPPPINNWITVCPYERCPISWARIPSIISSESKSNPSVMNSFLNTPEPKIDNEYYEIEEQYFRQFGHGVPREMLPDSISTEQIKQAMKKCILSKKDNLFELLGIIINDNYLY